MEKMPNIYSAGREKNAKCCFLDTNILLFILEKDAATTPETQEGKKKNTIQILLDNI